MSSSKLLEQAIVDAQALRDSAFKTAQATLLEKFAPQVREAVEKLLEQEPLTDEDPDAMSPEDALAGGQSDMPLTDFGGAPPDESNKGYVAGTAGDIPLAATDGEKLCPCPDDDEEVSLEINLADLADQLQMGDKEEEMDSIGLEQTPMAMGGAALEENLELEEEVDTEVDLDEALSEMDNMGDMGIDPNHSDWKASLREPPNDATGTLSPENQEKLNLLSKSFNEDEVSSILNLQKDKLEKFLDRYSMSDDKLTLVRKAQSSLEPQPGSDEGFGEYNVTEIEKTKTVVRGPDGVLRQKVRIDQPLEPEDRMPASRQPEPRIPSKRERDSVRENAHEDWLGDQAAPYGKITPADCNAVANKAAAKHKPELSEVKQSSQTKQLLSASTALLKEVESKDGKINKLLEENKTFASTIEQMSIAFKKLEEVNLLNARLFYENQILKSASLNERQKTQIVEAVSRADSVSEAKTIYETLINSVGSSSNEERRPKSLNEVVSKKSSFRLPHKQAEQPADQNKDRWLKLAGIK
jgi:hypothetical protein